MNMALMIIDLQKAFRNPQNTESMAAASEYINGALAQFRRKKLPVIWVQHIDDDDRVVPGEPGFDFIDELTPVEGEHRIHKRYGNSFTKTPVLDILRSAGIETVLVTGYCAEYCVLSTCRGALDHDLSPLLLRGAIASPVRENIRFVESINDIVSFGALLKLLDA